MGVIIDQRALMPINEDISRRFPIRELNRITHAVIHHSLTLSGSARAYANYHISHNNWETIAYHFVIDKDGTVNWTLDLEKVGWHGNSSNYFAIGICLTGNFDVQDPTAAQLTALVELLIELNQRLGRQLIIEPHRKYNTGKSCPGANFPIAEIRDRVANFTAPPLLSSPLAGATNLTLLTLGILLLFPRKM